MFERVDVTVVKKMANVLRFIFFPCILSAEYVELRGGSWPSHLIADLEDELEEAPRPAARQADAQDFGEFLEDEEEDEFGDFIEDDLGGGGGGAQGAAGEQPGRRRRRMTGMPAGVSAAAMRVNIASLEP